MPQGRPLAPLTLTDEQKDQLDGIARSNTLPSKAIAGGTSVSAWGPPRCALATMGRGASPARLRWSSRHRPLWIISSLVSIGSLTTVRSGLRQTPWAEPSGRTPRKFRRKPFSRASPFSPHVPARLLRAPCGI